MDVVYNLASNDKGKGWHNLNWWLTTHPSLEARVRLCDEIIWTLAPVYESRNKHRYVKDRTEVIGGRKLTSQDGGITGRT